MQFCQVALADVDHVGGSLEIPLLPTSLRESSFSGTSDSKEHKGKEHKKAEESDLQDRQHRSLFTCEKLVVIQVAKLEEVGVRHAAN